MKIDDDIILNYIDGLLSDDEQSRVEAALRDNPQLQQEVAVYRDMQRFSSHQVAQEQALTNLDEVHRDMRVRGKAAAPEEDQPANNFLSNTLKFLGLVAALMACLILGYKFVNGDIGSIKNPDNPELLFADNFDPSTISFTSRGDVEEDVLTKAATDFNAGDYDGSLAIFESYVSTHDTNPRISYAMAVALIAVDQQAEARELLATLQSNPLYKDDVQWYLGLSYLRSQNFDEARNALAGVGKTSNRYKSAQILLDNLGE